MNVQPASRLEAAFARAAKEGRPALITYLMPGYPTPEEAPEIFQALVDGGSDVIEIGIPFSDPLADGETIQRAGFKALENGVSVAKCVAFARDMRLRHPETGIVFMTYLNPVLSYGIEGFARDAALAGADGVILVDLPVEEASEVRSALSAQGLSLIFLLAPTSPDERVRQIAAQASGFIYCVSVTGVTGARSVLPADLGEFLRRVRRCTGLPLAVGFGISRRDQIEALSGVADGIVVASAIADIISATDKKERTRVVREFVEVLSGRRSP